MALAHRAVEIRKQAIAQLKILSADRLDCGVVQLARIGIRSLPVIADFIWPKFTGVPAPRQPQFPVAPMRPKQWTKRAELKPAHVQFTREFLCGHEAASVRAPKRNA